MATFLLIWNPSRGGWDPGELEDGISITGAGGLFESRWSTGKRQYDISRGDDLYLIRLGVEPRGIVGHGVARDEIFIDEHWEDPQKDSPYVSIEWRTLLETDKILPLADIQVAIPIRHNWEPQSSGVSLDEQPAEQLTNLWAQHLLNRGRKVPPVPAPPAAPTGRTSVQGGHQTRVVRARIGQGGFRDMLIARYGDECAVTGPTPRAALEAAHLYQYADNAVHHMDGGLLMRSDIHSLFDKGLLTIAPDGVISIHETLQNYPTYWQLNGQRLGITLTDGQKDWLKRR